MITHIMGLISKFLCIFDAKIPIGIINNGIEAFNAPSTKLISRFEDNNEMAIKYADKGFNI